MRKLKLQMQISIDGYVAGPNGEMDWMVWTEDADLQKYVMDITAPVDLIVMGRKLAEGFIPYWANVAAGPASPDLVFAKIMANTAKVVFSNTLGKSPWENVQIATGDLASEINKLKAQEGGDIIAYGGANFVSNLIKTGTIDEYHFSVNPTAIGKGMAIFAERTNLKLVKVTPFHCGKVVLHYEPLKK